MLSRSPASAPPEEAPAQRLSPGRSAPLKHVAALDGLRGIAVIIVILYHGGWLGVFGGFIGVDLFFLLSGFLITRLLVDEHAKTGQISMKSFYVRRGLRLLPALFALVASVWVIAFVLPETGFRDGLGNRTFWALSYLANWNDVFTGTHYGPFSHLWSLSVEEQFYVIWPLVVIAIIRRRGPDAVAKVALIGSVVCSVATATQFALGVAPFSLYYGTHSHGAILLLAGSWLGANRALVERITVDVANRLLAVGLAGLTIMMFGPANFSFLHPGMGYLPVTLTTLALVAGAVGNPTFAPLRLAPLRLAGRLSYGLYLWHIPMFSITRALIPDAPRLLAVAGCSLVAAVISYVVVEQPAMRLKHRLA